MWVTPVLSATGDLITASLYSINYYGLRYLKGLDGAITLESDIAGTAYAGFAGGVGSHTHATAGAEGGQLDWDNIWSDAVHSHATDAEGGKLATLQRGFTHSNYSGSDAVDRAIPHGLANTPVLIMLVASDGTFFNIQGGTGAIFFVNSGADGYLTVAILDATNFYVGNATSYANSANASGITYYWTAFG